MKKLLTVLLFLLLFGSVKAQDSTVVKYSLKEAINYALANEASVKNALLEERNAKQKVNELIGVGTPQINGSAEINDFIEIPTSFIPGEFFGGEPGSYLGVKFGQQYTASAGVSVSQLIFDGSYLVGLQASKTYQELSRKQTQQTKVQLVTNVSKAYYAALVMDERMEQLEANITRVKKAVDDTRALFDNGFAEKIDADRIELTYNNLLVERAKVNRYKVLNYALLKFQMGLDPKTVVELTDLLKDYQLQDPTLPDSVDYNKKPEFEVLMVQRNLQNLDLRRYKSNYIPSLSAFGSLSANASRDEFDIFDTDKPWYPTAIIGVRLSVPIWDGLQKNARVQQSKISLQKIDNAIVQAKQGIQVEYINSRSNFENTKASLGMTKKNRDLAAEIARVSKVKYDNGVGSSLELIDAESALRESDANYYNTLYETIVAKIDLDKATGNITY